MTRDQLRDRLKFEVGQESVRRVASRYDVSPAFVHQVIHGRARLSDALAERMGYRRVETFEPVAREERA